MDDNDNRPGTWKPGHATWIHRYRNSWTMDLQDVPTDTILREILDRMASVAGWPDGPEKSSAGVEIGMLLYSVTCHLSSRDERRPEWFDQDPMAPLALDAMNSIEFRNWA